MKLRNLLTISLQILLSFIAIAQNGPGGIGNTTGNSGLQLWLKASDLAESHVDGDKVLTWTDQSGAANHVYGVDPGTPTFKTGTAENHSFVEFNGNQFLQTKEASSSFQNPESTIFLVKRGAYKGTAIAIAEQGWVNEMLLFDYAQFHHSSSGNNTKLTHPCIRQIPNNEPTIIGAVFGQEVNDLRYFVNGQEASNSTLRTSGRPWEFETVNRKVTIGQRDQFVASEFLEGGILEVIVYNRKLNDEEIQEVEEYLQCSYQVAPSVCTELSILACVENPVEDSCPLLTDSIDIDPLQLWLKASSLETSLANGDKVTLWQDQSGHSNHVSAATQSAPIFKQGSLNMPSAVAFNGAEFLQTNDVSNSFNNPESTIFLVKKGAYKGAAIAIAEDGWKNEMLLFDQAQFHHSSSGNFTKLTHPCIEQIPDEQPTIICGVFGPSEEELRYFVNGEETTSTITQSAGQPWDFEQVDRKVTIGQRDQFVASEFFEGDLLEVLVFNTQLTDQEIDQVENYLTCTYQLEPTICMELDESNEELEPSPIDSCAQYTGTILEDACGRVFIHAFDANHDSLLIVPVYEEESDQPSIGTTFQFDITIILADQVAEDACQGFKPVFTSGILTCINIIEEGITSTDNDNNDTNDNNDCNCPQVLNPVCGTDGTVYNNHCEAECAGVGIVSCGASCNPNDLCVVIIKNGLCKTIGIYDENDNLLTTMKPGPIDGFNDGFTYWEDLCFLLRGATKTYTFKADNMVIDRQTASCENNILTLVSDLADPCAEIIDSTENNHAEAIFSDYTWLIDVVDPVQCIKTTVAVYQSSIYKYFLVTDEDGISTLYNEQGQFYCQNSLGYDCVAAYNLGNPISTWSCTSNEVPTSYNEEPTNDDDESASDNDQPTDSIIVFNDYPWLTNLTDTDSCSIEHIAIYRSGIYEYLLLTFATDISILYNAEGQFYCQNSTGYDCVAAYNLGAPIDTWVCSGTTPVIEEPCICPQVIAPVCGTDGVTYNNACEAACAGVTVAFDTPCDSSTFDLLNEIEIGEVECVSEEVFIVNLIVNNSTGETPLYRFYSEAGSPFVFDLILSPFGGATLAFPAKLAEEIVFLVEEVANPNNQTRVVKTIPTCGGLVTEEGAEERAARTTLVDFSIFPNPTLEHITLSIPAPSTNPYQLYVHDLFGRTLYQEEVAPLATSVSINMKEYEDGMYYIELRTAGRRGMQKVMKQGLE